jgi:hypothetical protein
VPQLLRRHLRRLRGSSGEAIIIIIIIIIIFITRALSGTAFLHHQVMTSSRAHVRTPFLQSERLSVADTALDDDVRTPFCLWFRLLLLFLCFVFAADVDITRCSRRR